MRQPVLLATTLILLCLIGFSPFARSAESISLDDRFQFRLVSWFVAPSGDIKVEDNDIGTDVDIERDLALGDDTSPGLQLLFRPWQSTILAFGYQSLSFQGSNTIERAIQFGGQTYVVGADVESELDVAFYDLDLRRSIIQELDSELSWGLGVSVLDVDASAEGQTAGGVEKESGSAVAILPNLALGGRFQPTDFFYVRCEARGIYAGSYGHIADVDAAIGATVARYFTLEAGYRIFDFGLDVRDVNAGITFDGFFIAGALNF